MPTLKRARKRFLRNIHNLKRNEKKKRKERSNKKRMLRKRRKTNLIYETSKENNKDFLKLHLKNLKKKMKERLRKE